VNDLAFSSQGYLAVGGANGSNGVVSIRDSGSGEALFALPSAVPPVQSLAFSNGGDMIAVGTASGTADFGKVYLWLLEYSDRLYELPYEAGDITDVAFSPDDSLIAASSPSSVSLWQVIGNELVQTLTAEAQTSAFSSLSFSPDGQMLAAGTRDGVVYIWQVADGQRLYRCDTGAKSVQSLAFSADGQQFATVATNGQVTIWQFGDSGPELQFSGQTAEREGLTTDVIFIDDTVLAAVGLANGQVELWQAAK
jgi:WD40 repeat protein